MNIAIIPARGGSKRIPGKNIKEFCGILMIAWAVNAAKKSKLFDHIIVSTDNEETSNIAKILDIEVPFIRPAELADDMTPTISVVAHAISCLSLTWNIDYVCCIYPCAPLLQSDDLINALHLIKTKSSKFVYPVTEYPHPIQRAMRKSLNGLMEFYTPESELKRTQDFETAYHDAGQFYWAKPSAWLEQKNMHSKGFGMVIPNWKVVDIDTIEDWQRAEIVFKILYP